MEFKTCMIAYINMHQCPLVDANNAFPAQALSLAATAFEGIGSEFQVAVVWVCLPG